MAPHCSQGKCKTPQMPAMRPLGLALPTSPFLSPSLHSPPQSRWPSFRPTLAMSLHPQASAHAVPAACNALPSQPGLVHFSASLRSRLLINLFLPLLDQGLMQSETCPFCLQPGTESKSWHLLRAYHVPGIVLLFSMHNPCGSLSQPYEV